MILVLPHALPPAALATELGKRLADAAPTLIKWLAGASAQVQVTPPAEYACTPLQTWQLQHAGYQAPDDVPLGAGWAVLAASPPADAATEPVWLAEFVHLHVSHQGVTLTDPAALALATADAERLLETARPDFEDAGIQARLDNAGRLRLVLPETLAPYAPTPAVAIGNEIQAWWSQQTSVRPWRRVLNAVQMAWHDDPVNVARGQNGLLPVNGLWLYGGARPADFSRLHASGDETTIDDAFSASAQAGDWAAWLAAARALEAGRFAKLDSALAQPGAEPLTLVLTGEDRLATLQVKPPRGLSRWLPRRRENWQAWWSSAQSPPTH